jgi:hypothetical protein
MLTVACVWIKSPMYNDVSWVVKLKNMVDRYVGCTSWPYRFVCITDQVGKLWGEDIGGIELVRPELVPPVGYPNWWYKLNVFNLKADKVLYFDLDVVILGSLHDMVHFPSDFVTAPSSGMPMKNHDFNSSVMMFRPEGESAQYVRSLLRKVPYGKHKGDQQWLSNLKMRVDLFPSQWVSKYYPGKAPGRPKPGTKVSLLIQGGKNQALLDAGHSWIGEYWK